MLSNIKIIKKYFKVVEVDKKSLIFLFITSFMVQVPYMFTSFVWSLFIKYLLEKNINLIVITLILNVGLKAISKVFKVINFKIEKKYYNYTYRKLQNNMANKINELNIDYFNNDRKGNVINIANNDIKQLSNFGNWIVNTIISFIGFLTSMFFLISVSYWLIIFGLIIDGIMIAILNKYNIKYEKIVRDMKKENDSESGFFTQIINGISEIKIFNIGKAINKKYKQKNERYIEKHNEQIDNKIIRQVVSPSISLFSSLVLMIYYVYGFLNNILNIDTIVLISSYFGEMFKELNSFVDKLNELRDISVSIERYYDFINEREKIIMFGDNKKDKIEGNIIFDNVSFGYNGKEIIKDINIKIPARTITAIVGESGSGKSTLFNLLLRFYKQNSGKIKIDDIDIFEFDKETYSHNISIVKQDSFMFNMSIYENLALINPDRNKIMEACKKVRLHEYIENLPNGYDTIISEGGTTLSGGQRQRLSIARTLLKESEIILLDEITSSLNRELSLEIFEVLLELKENHTILIITHKNEEYLKCDNIININNGKVIEKV